MSKGHTNQLYLHAVDRIIVKPKEKRQSEGGPYTVLEIAFWQEENTSQYADILVTAFTHDKEDIELEVQT